MGASSLGLNKGTAVEPNFMNKVPSRLGYALLPLLDYTNHVLQLHGQVSC